MKVVLDSASVADGDRIASWQEALAQWLAPVEVTAHDSRPFQGVLATAHLGYLRMLSLDADPVRLRRGSLPVSDAQRGMLTVVLQGTGAGELTQDGRSTLLRPGELSVVDLSRPFSLDQRHRFGLTLFQLPERAVGATGWRMAHLTGRTVIPAEDGAAPLALAFLAGLPRTAAEVSPDVGDLLAGAAADFLTTLLEPAAEVGGTLRPAGDHLVPAIRDFIDEHLADPDLCPERIAASHQISVRYMHRLFEGEGVTVGRLIQQRRVEACGRELKRRSRVTPTISAVARRWGFPSPAHFSRAFKAVYGVTPREWAGGSGAAGGNPVPTTGDEAVR
ncbi:helix-turn-helix domain-containing protein [Streptomyces sp. NPDC002054]|uniref:helix-turn-helix domain-containing protein n=1 Tax=Streptomyces sp. NPDC002054 TaxID=3154663 RepID=UPI00331E3EFF